MKIRTLHLGLTLAALAVVALALGIECLDWRALTGGSIAAILAVKLLIEDAFEPRPVKTAHRASCASRDARW